MKTLGCNVPGGEMELDRLVVLGLVVVEVVHSPSSASRGIHEGLR